MLGRRRMRERSDVLDICTCCANRATLLTSLRVWNIHETCSQPPRICTNVSGLIFEILRRLDPTEQTARRNRRKTLIKSETISPSITVVCRKFHLSCYLRLSALMSSMEKCVRHVDILILFNSAKVQLG